MGSRWPGRNTGAVRPSIHSTLWPSCQARCTASMPAFVPWTAIVSGTFAFSRCWGLPRIGSVSGKCVMNASRFSTWPTSASFICWTVMSGRPSLGTLGQMASPSSRCAPSPVATTTNAAEYSPWVVVMRNTSPT